MRRAVVLVLGLLLCLTARAAVDSAGKRYSVINMAGSTLPIPDGTIAAADRQHLLGLYSGLAAAEPSAAGAGAIDTTFTSSSLPASAVYRAGVAYTPAGSRYVSSCTPPAVVYVAGVAHTTEGATCVSPGDTIDAYVGGWPVTDDGEVVADTCTPVFFVNGIPTDTAGAVCMTDID